MGTRTERLEAHSRKQVTVSWQAICVSGLLAVQCMYQLLLNSGICYSLDVYYHFFLEKTVPLCSAFSVLLFFF